MKHHFLSLLTCFSCLSSTPSMAAQHDGPAVGSMAPDFKAHNVVTGQTAPLSSQRGKVVILTFWASWCAPCRREVPILEKAQRFIGKDKLTVFAVSFQENQQAVAALKKVAADWQINVIEDNNGWIASRYSITSIPHLFIIGRDGKVLANHLGYGDSTIEELVGDINHAFAEPAPVEQQVSPAATDTT